MMKCCCVQELATNEEKMAVADDILKKAMQQGLRALQSAAEEFDGRDLEVLLFSADGDSLHQVRPDHYL